MPWIVVLTTILDKISCKKIWKFCSLKIPYFLNFKGYEIYAPFWVSKIKAFCKPVFLPAPNLQCWGLIGDESTISCFNIVTVVWGMILPYWGQVWKKCIFLGKIVTFPTISYVFLYWKIQNFPPNGHISLEGASCFPHFFPPWLRC